jgi:hypothetical protein
VDTVLRRSLEALRVSAGAYARTAEYDRLELEELEALEAEARRKSRGAASLAASRGGAASGSSPSAVSRAALQDTAEAEVEGGAEAGVEGVAEEANEDASARDCAAPGDAGSLASSIQVTTIVELDPYYWRRICAAAVRLAKYLQARDQLVAEGVARLEALVELEARRAGVEEELAAPRAELEAVEQDNREREARLRHAVIDLSLKRSMPLGAASGGGSGGGSSGGSGGGSGGGSSGGSGGGSGGGSSGGSFGASGGGTGGGCSGGGSSRGSPSASSGGPSGDGNEEPASGMDLDYQIRALEQQLAETYREGRRRRAEVEPRVRALEQRAEQIQQAQLELELELLETLRCHRPDASSVSAEIDAAFEHLEQLLREVA